MAWRILFFKADPRWPNNISYAADNTIFKNRPQNIEFSFACVPRSAVLLKPNVAKMITIAIDCNGLSLLIFEEKCPNYSSGPKSAPNSDSFWLGRLLNVCVRVFYAPNAIILFVFIPVKIKMSFIWKDNFLLPKLVSSVSWSQAHLTKHCSSVYTTILIRWKDKTNYLSNQTWAKCYHSRNKH